MKQTTSSLPFFKTVLLSISILALSSLSAYAGQANQTHPVKYQLIHSDGFVTVVSNDGRISKPYPEFTFDAQTGWIAKDFHSAQDDDFPWIPGAEALCPNGSCILNVDGKDKPVSSLFENGSAAPLSASGVGVSSHFADNILEQCRIEFERIQREFCENFGIDCPAPAPAPIPTPPACDLKCMKDRSDDIISKM